MPVSPVLRRARGLLLRVVGEDAIVEHPHAPALYLAGEGERLQRLWNLLDEPKPARTLLAALGEPGADALLLRLIDAKALYAWPLATRLAQIHLATAAPATLQPATPDSEDDRLLREYGGESGCELPTPVLTADLAASLRGRRTEREMSGASLSLAQLSTLLAFGGGAAGRTALPSYPGGPPGGRTYPSGGALYPIEILVRAVCVEGLGSSHYRYQVLAHRLVAMTAAQCRSSVELSLKHNHVTGASAVFLLWADFTRPSLGKYGEKAYRLALLEAGHLAQNLLVVATAIGLAGVPICGFDDEQLAFDAGLAYPEQPIVYAVAVGARQATTDSAVDRP